MQLLENAIYIQHVSAPECYIKSISAEMNKNLGNILNNINSVKISTYDLQSRCTEQKFLPLLHTEVFAIILRKKTNSKITSYI